MHIKLSPLRIYQRFSLDTSDNTCYNKHRPLYICWPVRAALGSSPGQTENLLAKFKYCMTTKEWISYLL